MDIDDGVTTAQTRMDAVMGQITKLVQTKGECLCVCMYVCGL